MIKKTLGMMTVVAMSGSAFADVNVSGYADAGYNWSNRAAGNESNFAFNEGGIWFTGNSGATAFVLDVGVRNMAANVEQGYVSHKFDNGFSWSLGLMDAIVGVESSDSVNNPFVNTGILYDLTNSYETGLLLGYDLSDALKAEVLVANGDNSKAMAGAEFDYPALGFRLTSKMDGLSAHVAGRFASDGDENGYAIDIGATTAFGAFHVGAELLLLKAAVANSESGIGFGLHLGTEVAEATKLNVGFEWENGSGSEVSHMELRAGPTWALSEALALKADYTYSMYSGDAAKLAAKSKTDDAMHGIAVAGVYKF